MFASIDSTLPRRSKNKCGGLFFSSLLFNRRRSLKKTVLTCSAVSSPSLSSSGHTMCCQSVCGWIPGDGPEDEIGVRYVMSAKVRRRGGGRRVSLKLQLYVPYGRCLADASDSVMWSFRRLQGNILTCLRSSSADNTTRSVEWSCRHRGQIVRQQPSGTNMWNNPSVLLINRFQTQLDFVLVLCHCQFSSADHFASL